MEKNILLTRNEELEKLNWFLSKSIKKQGQVCFIEGEAGSGKSTLLDKFVEIAQKKNEGLIVAIGNCNSTTGFGDPYLPFREVLCLLTGDTKAKIDQGFISQTNAERLQKFARMATEALVELGPDLIGSFIPFAGLATKAATFWAGKSGLLPKIESLEKKKKEIDDDGLDQSHIFEQYTQVIQKIASLTPFVMILDDLQWADSASIGLFFHISRRIEQYSVLLVGAFRPDDVLMGRNGQRHPLDPVINEIKKYYGDVEIDLSLATEQRGYEFVNLFIDNEPNRLSEVFRQQMFSHTGGNPLFTIELLRNMQERGDIFKNQENEWIESPNLYWDKLPARVEGVIAERFFRLEARLRELLSVAAVEGESFTAQVLADVENKNAREIANQLANLLQHRQGLISESGIQSLGTQLLFLYHFRHSLFQKYVYDQLSQSERILLHQSVADALEKLYQSQTIDIARQLAHHYLESRQDQKALNYLIQAGDAAVNVHAHVEALIHYSRALMVAKKNRSDCKIISSLFLKFGRSLELLGRYLEALRNYEDMENWAQQICEPSMVLRALIARATIHSTPTTLFNPAIGRELCNDALNLAKEQKDYEGAAKISWNLLLLNSFTGHPLEAIKYGEQALAMARRIKDRKLEAFTLNDLSYPYVAVGKLEDGIEALNYARKIWGEVQNLPMLVDNLARSATVSFLAGDYQNSIAFSEEAWQRSIKIGNLWGQSFSKKNICYVHLDYGDFDSAVEAMKECIEVAERAGNIDVLVGTRADLGYVYGSLGAVEDGINLCKQACAIGENQAKEWLPWALADLGRIFIMQNDIAQAEVVIKKARKLYSHKDPTHELTPIVLPLAEAELLFAKNEFADAISIINSMIKELQIIHVKPFTLDAILIKSKSLLALGRFEECRSNLEEAAREAEQRGILRLLWQIYILLANIELNMGNAKSGARRTLIPE